VIISAALDHVSPLEQADVLTRDVFIL